MTEQKTKHPAGMGHNSNHKPDGTFAEGNTPQRKKLTADQQKRRDEINEKKADTQLDVDEVLAKSKNLVVKARVDIINYAMGYDKNALPKDSQIRTAIDAAFKKGNGLRDLYGLMAQHDDRANGKAGQAPEEGNSNPIVMNEGQLAT